MFDFKGEGKFDLIPILFLNDFHANQQRYQVDDYTQGLTQLNKSFDWESNSNILEIHFFLNAKDGTHHKMMLEKVRSRETSVVCPL